MPTPNPEIFICRDAEVRVFDADPSERDPGLMYVLDALGVTINIYQRARGGTYVGVEEVAIPDKHALLLVEVNNGGERFYTPEHPRGRMDKDIIPVPQTVGGYRVISAVQVKAGQGEIALQWIVICDRGDQRYTADRRYVTWLVYWHPSFPDDKGSYQASEGCYDLTREEADISLEQRTTGGRKYLQYLAKDDQRRDGERS